MNLLHLEYKRDTGNSPIEEIIEIGVIRMRGLWVLDPAEINDDEVLQLFGSSGTLILNIPAQAYIEYLEDRLQFYTTHLP